MLTDEQLFEITRKREIAELECLVRLGVVKGDTTEDEIFFNIWPRVFGDRVVGERLNETRDSLVGVLNALNHAERIALRDRILGVKEFPRAITPRAD